MNEKCQVFTPENYVEELLDSIDYEKRLYGKKIIENSCGDGNILVSIVRRYIKSCREEGLSKTRIKNGLARDIYGVEIDKKYYRKCIDNLGIVLREENIGTVDWKIYNKDYLRVNLEIEFDFVVGNPPYITYSELQEMDRRYIKENFSTCKEGKFDYCYAFIEKSLKSLKPTGKMSYLIPSSIFKTVFGKNLRSLIRGYVTQIRDYTTHKVFNEALVASAIMVLDKNRTGEQLNYFDVVNNLVKYIDSSNLGDKWFFTNNIVTGNQRFGNSFNVSHVVATLLNEAFVIKKWNVQEDYIRCGEYKIEKRVVRMTATPRSLKYDKKELIIFPYHYDSNGTLIKYTENEFEDYFPEATIYLNRYRKKLDARKKDESAKWFEYGRSQALTLLNTDKLLISTVVTERVNVYQLSEEYIPYGGMYVVPINNQMNLLDAKRILQSNDFMQYVKKVGIHISGNSLRITSKDIMDYRF